MRTDKLQALEFLQSGFSQLINSSNLEQKDQVTLKRVEPLYFPVPESREESKNLYQLFLNSKHLYFAADV